jgi:hypothetical protein
MSQEEMRSNPEVMGRTEPKDMARSEPKDVPRSEPKDVPRSEPTEMPRSEPKDIPVRSEPKDMPAKRSEAMEKPSPSQDGEMGFWPEMHEYKHRMTDIQSEFIEEPKAAVKKAEQLIEEAVDYMAKSVHERVQRMHNDAESDADTEKLRLMMRNFSHLIDRLDGSRAA